MHQVRRNCWSQLLLMAQKERGKRHQHYLQSQHGMAAVWVAMAGNGRQGGIKQPMQQVSGACVGLHAVLTCAHVYRACRWTSAGAFYPLSRNHINYFTKPHEPYR